MPLQFTQEEVETELADQLKHGRRADVARKSGLGESYIKRQFNPDDETPSCAFKLLQIACALDDIDEPEGEAFWQSLCRFRELSKKRKSSSCLNHETGKLNKEVAEFVSAKIENKPFNVQLKELLEAQTQLEIVKQELIGAYNELHSKPREVVVPFK
jgi:hypothetical protein